MFCEFCALQFGNMTVFKMHLKLVHNIIKEGEEMTLVKPEERLTRTQNMNILPSQILELTPESQENEQIEISLNLENSTADQNHASSSYQNCPSVVNASQFTDNASGSQIGSGSNTRMRSEGNFVPKSLKQSTSLTRDGTQFQLNYNNLSESAKRIIDNSLKNSLKKSCSKSNSTLSKSANAPKQSSKSPALASPRCVSKSKPPCPEKNRK